ncbi:MAG: hypothetical protein KDA84_28070 [Planctomycetaceae bacterium]|nr:hypothetical protein [Planctomycetaceae bacterium]
MTPTILIFERRPRWVPELERQFLGQEFRIRGCATLQDLETRLTFNPGGLCLVELDAAPGEGLLFLGRLMARARSPKIIVVATQTFHELEWVIRELGVITFLEEPIPGDDMAAWCRRQFS